MTADMDALKTRTWL